MKTLIELFPRASKSTIEANPHLLSVNDKPGTGSAEDMTATSVSPPSRGKMNKTESEFAMMLEAQKRNGEILHYEYEGMTLRWSGIQYTPDFVVFSEKNKIIHWSPTKGIVATQYCPVLIEVKGGWTKGKFERAVERFRHAKTYWHWFQFELHQKTKSGWKRIY